MRAREEEEEGSIVAIVGAPGSGKTLATADALSHELARGRRVVALDLTGDLRTYLRDAGLSPDGCATVSSYDEAVRWRPREPRVIFFAIGGERVEKTIEDWLRFACDKHRAGDVYVCDEAELAFPNGKRSDYGFRLIKLARNWRVRLYACAQRPQLLDPLLRSNATHVAVFRSDSRLFVDGCKEFGDVELYSRANILPQHHYLYRPRFHSGGPLERYDAREERAPWLD